jgi:hypothetical protein
VGVGSGDGRHAGQDEGDRPGEQPSISSKRPSAPLIVMGEALFMASRKVEVLGRAVLEHQQRRYDAQNAQ